MKDMHMHRPRLRKLYDRLREVPDGELATGSWGKKCPSWYAMELFRDEGLHPWTKSIPCYRGYVGFEAISEFFEISTEDAEQLFGARSLREGEHHVIIRRFGNYLAVGWEHLMPPDTLLR